MRVGGRETAEQEKTGEEGTTGEVVLESSLEDFPLLFGPRGHSPSAAAARGEAGGTPGRASGAALCIFRHEGRIKSVVPADPPVRQDEPPAPPRGLRT